MKKKILFLALSLICVLSLAIGVFASDSRLSPAMDIIAKEFNMVKTGVAGKDIVFTEEDFVSASGGEPSSITITALPPEGDGKLVLGGSNVEVGQTISRSNLELLRFIPSKSTAESVFRFSFDRSYTTACKIKLISEKNSAPVISENGITVMTQTDISVFGKLDGYDADGDKLNFEITEYPALGLINLTDSSSGNFCYTPYDGVTGVDSFSYCVSDEYGNYSKVSEVSLKIEKRASEMVLADMDGHWAHNAALTLASCNAMDVISENGKLYFDPDEVMSREEFLKVAMKALGAGELSDRTTVFADNESISPSCRGYVAAAYSLGLVKGNGNGNALMFNPKDSITKSEAASILNRIIGADSHGSVISFSDGDTVPVWAVGDISALIEIGILSGSDNGMICANASLSRAEAAQMLYATKLKYS